MDKHTIKAKVIHERDIEFVPPDDDDRERALQELAKQAQELDMGYERPKGDG